MFSKIFKNLSTPNPVTKPVEKNSNPANEIEQQNSIASFSCVFQQGDSYNGIGNYDLKHPADRVFAFDYNQTGKTDHLVLYRPGEGIFWILKNENNTFIPVFQQGDSYNGIAGYDLRSAEDRVFAFDYNRSGKLDHLVLYRPGTGIFWILKNTKGVFSPVFQQGNDFNGIGGYNLKSTADRAFAFDYDHSGILDHIALYRPGEGIFWILKNIKGSFSPVYQQTDASVGHYKLDSVADRAFAFDYNHNGKLDHIALYRPGTGIFSIVKNSAGVFSSVYQQTETERGIGGYSLDSSTDRAFAFDYAQNGKLDHIALYRPGSGIFWVLKNTNGSFSSVFQQGDDFNGIAGYDLKSSSDKILPFDYTQNGKKDHLIIYRAGSGIFWVVKKS
jgi:hypothetical protein